MNDLGLQSDAPCSAKFIENLQTYGIDDMRLKSDYLTRTDFKNVIIVWSFQFILASYVVFSTELPLQDIYMQQLTVEFGVTRLITQVVMHVLMQREFEQALNMMKYTVNHPWKFRSVSLAFSAGLMQLVISCIVEVSNIYITLANGST